MVIEILAFRLISVIFRLEVLNGKWRFGLFGKFHYLNNLSPASSCKAAKATSVHPGGIWLTSHLPHLLFWLPKAGLYHNYDKNSRKTFIVARSSRKYLFMLASRKSEDDLFIVSKLLDGIE